MGAVVCNGGGQSAAGDGVKTGLGAVGKNAEILFHWEKTPFTFWIKVQKNMGFKYSIQYSRVDFKPLFPGFYRRKNEGHIVSAGRK